MQHVARGYALVPRDGQETANPRASRILRQHLSALASLSDVSEPPLVSGRTTRPSSDHSVRPARVRESVEDSDIGSEDEPAGECGFLVRHSRSCRATRALLTLPDSTRARRLPCVRTGQIPHLKWIP